MRAQMCPPSLRGQQGNLNTGARKLKTHPEFEVDKKMKHEPLNTATQNGFLERKG